MKKTAVVAVSSVLVLGLAACSEDGPTVSAPAPSSSTAQPTPTASTETTQPSTTSSPAPSTTSTQARGPLKAGTCLGPKPGYAQVPCTGPYTYEVFFAKPDAKYANDLVKRGGWVSATCYDEGAKFLGNGGFAMSRFDIEPVTAVANPDAAGTIACAIKEYRKTGTGLASRSSSAKGLLKGDKFHDYSWCVEGKASADQIKLVACSEPHTSVAVGGKLNGKPGSAYPGDEKIHAAARKYCAPLASKYLGAKRSDVVYAENSGGPGPWRRGAMFSACFVEVKDGSKVKKSLKGIGNKPLDSYR